jgi:hypothetical protein
VFGLAGCAAGFTLPRGAELLDRPHTQGSCKNADNKEPLLGVLDGMNAERNDHDADTELDEFAVIRHGAPFCLPSRGQAKFVCYCAPFANARTPDSLNLPG